MSKKKSSTKKHKFKHVESAVPESGVGPILNTASSVSGVSQPSHKQAVTTGGRDFSYVTKDLRSIGLMAGVLFAIELSFYYLLVFTPVGAAVYKLVNV